MRIIGLIQPGSGPTYHRIQLPLLLMPDVDAYLTNLIRESDFDKGCDIVYVSRYAFYNELDQLIQWRDKYGFALIVDVDDYWVPDRHHILYDQWQDKDIAGQMIAYLKAADLVTCTHARLAAEVQHYNTNVHVLPNAIPGYYEQFQTRPVPAETIRLFWQGSNTHKKDIDILRGPLKRVSSDPDLMQSVHMIYCGYLKGGVTTNIHANGTYTLTIENTQCDEMVSAYTNGLKLNGSIFEGKPLDEYYTFYRFCDIAIVPLLATRFNGFKSNLKVLEAANVAAPCIVSKVDPYLNMPVNYVEKQTDWYKHIRALVKDEAWRLESGLELQAFCNEHYNFDKINAERKQLCESLITIHAS